MPTVIAVGPSTGKGRGVFATRRITTGALIEEAPVVVVPAFEVEHLEKTVLQDYYFVWGEKEDEAAVCLGLCSLCNHAYRPNAMFVPSFETLTIRFVALRDIEAGEEITTNYNGPPGSQDPVWFDVLR